MCIYFVLKNGWASLKLGADSDGTWGRHLGFHKPEILHIDYLFLIGHNYLWKVRFLSEL